MSEAQAASETPEVVNPFAIAKTINKLVSFGIPDETGKLVPISFPLDVATRICGAQYGGAEKCAAQI